MSGQVYFVRVGVDGPIKIGFTTDLPESRLTHLQVGCPWPLTIIGSRSGSIFQEQVLHKKFSAIRMTGEWFEATPELLAEIAEVLTPNYAWPQDEPVPVVSGYSINKFLAEIEEFLRETGMSATAFGMRAVNDPRLIHDLRKEGRQPSLRLVDRSYLFMREFRAGAAA